MVRKSVVRLLLRCEVEKFGLLRYLCGEFSTQTGRHTSRDRYFDRYDDERVIGNGFCLCCRCDAAGGTEA